MNDIEIARKKLISEDFTFVLINNSTQITSKDRGIKPMFLALTQHPEKMTGASIADKVIGKAAAMLAAQGGVSSIYTPLASKGAVDVCKRQGINLKAGKVVEAIQNRDKTGLCPMEKLARNEDDHSEVVKKVRDFLLKIEAIDPV